MDTYFVKPSKLVNGNVGRCSNPLCNAEQRVLVAVEKQLSHRPVDEHLALRGVERGAQAPSHEEVVLDLSSRALRE